LQISRVAGARGTSPEKIADLLKRHIEGRALGVFGERRVNVLELNRELDQAFPRNPNYKANE
jgi:potassium-transporting ATPase KdpC subunit